MQDLQSSAMQYNLKPDHSSTSAVYTHFIQDFSPFRSLMHLASSVFAAEKVYF